MFKTLRNAFKVKDIRDRILFTFLMLIIIRIGSELPAPGVDGEVFKQWWASQSADGLLNKRFCKRLKEEIKHIIFLINPIIYLKIKSKR